MKKILLALAIIFCFCGAATADTIDVEVDSIKPGNKNNTVKIYRYSGSTVAGTTTQVFRLKDVPNIYGSLAGWGFESLSDDCDAYGSTAENAAFLDIETFFGKVGIDTGYSIVFPSPEYFYNRDTPPARDLYFTIKNDSATATGTWELRLLFPEAQ